MGRQGRLNSVGAPREYAPQVLALLRTTYFAPLRATLATRSQLVRLAFSHGFDMASQRAYWASKSGRETYEPEPQVVPCAAHGQCCECAVHRLKFARRVGIAHPCGCAMLTREQRTQKKAKRKHLAFVFTSSFDEPTSILSVTDFSAILQDLILHAVGLEPTSTNTLRPEHNPLDRSGKLAG